MNATDDIYISVVAPNISKADGEYKYQIAISFDEYYHNYDAKNGTAQLLLMDFDSTSALLFTRLGRDSADHEEAATISDIYRGRQIKIHRWPATLNLWPRGPRGNLGQR
ncbi:hypothetical protein LB503_003139 [Fusarium chuoi]|nr:hypothetical protein LB503_003139 [Fusarium chuoi]